jgi:hypothetical protein
MGTVLSMCSLGVLVIALLCAMGGANGVPEVATLHHLFGLALAVMGFVLLAVGIALASLVPPKWASHPNTTDGSGVLDPRSDPD